MVLFLCSVFVRQHPTAPTATTKSSSQQPVNMYCLYETLIRFSRIYRSMPQGTSFIISLCVWVCILPKKEPSICLSFRVAFTRSIPLRETNQRRCERCVSSCPFLFPNGSYCLLPVSLLVHLMSHSVPHGSVPEQDASNDSKSSRRLVVRGVEDQLNMCKCRIEVRIG